MGDGNFKWYAAGGKDPERYAIVEDTREAAIQAARNDELDGEYYNGFTIVEADKAVAGIPDADRFLEMFFEQNEELGDADGDGFGADYSGTREQEKELTADLARVFSNWMNKHKLWPDTWQFGTQRNEEYFPPAVKSVA
ncbi:hypothetical protein [Mesorhizobium sp. NZP2298]|uniref:hypothetical protein n=1 Tax=Mesorhizobium sp. NZP2298 TaxID=2483403 RepID=UPI001555A540|nr:hypothetical protein [Mesorhizobium sp. NZP2298]QKC99210.1 hypothetical protein EB231_35070 [Mesorhizobium sp. NZP2298]